MPERPGLLATLAWFTAGCMAAAAVDLAQVAQGTGSVGFLGLALMVLGIYLLLGLVAALLLAPLLARLAPGLTAAVGLLLPPAALAAGYLNVVHLPSILDPLTISVNVTLAALLVAALWLAGRSSMAAALSGGAGVPASLALLAALAALLLALPGGDREVEVGAVYRGDAPNVFVVIIDSLRYDRTGAAGPDSLTPNLDALALEGVSYRRAYAQASWTKPSVASLFTSLFPSSHGANLRRDRLSDEPVTLAEVFGGAGYRTAVFSANPWISPAFGFDRGVHDFVESERETFVRLVVVLRLLKLPDRMLSGRPLSSLLARVEELFGLGSEHRSNCLRDDMLAASFEKWLESHVGTRPLFAYFHLMGPHIPYDPPRNPGGFDNEDQVALLHSEAALSRERHALLERLYDMTVEYSDGVLGRIVEAVEHAGIADNSVFVVTADHGEEFHEHGRWGHGKSLYDEVARVPLVVAGPGLPAGVAVESSAMLVDVLPSLALLAEVESPRGLAGSPLEEDRSRIAYAELLREGGVEHYMLVDGERKYIESRASLGEDLHTELYDLGADPGEHDDLAASAPDAADLAQGLDALREGARGLKVRGAVTDIDEEEAARLRALGYIK